MRQYILKLIPINRRTYLQLLQHLLLLIIIVLPLPDLRNDHRKFLVVPTALNRPDKHFKILGVIPNLMLETVLNTLLWIRLLIAGRPYKEGLLLAHADHSTEAG